MTPAEHGRRGGKGKCSVCAHDQQELIDQELAAAVPLRKLATRYGLSMTALLMHRRNHLSPALLSLQLQRGAGQVLQKLNDAFDQAELMYQAARAVRNMPLSLRAAAEKRSLLELIAKVTGELDERPQVTVNIQQTAAFIAVRSVVFEELEEFPEVRKRISARLRLLADNEAV